MTILAIETSCDDTAAAVVTDGEVRSNVISSQDIHDRYGGIIPELASREHVQAIGPIVRAALAEAGTEVDAVDAIAVTYGPGLAGSLIVGTNFAKGLALRFGKPLVPIHHIEAHVYSGYLEQPDLPFPSVCLVVSGGHTALFLVRSFMDYSLVGSTRDDAAGEAFDKVAKMMGLGYPGGPHIDRLAAEGRADAVAFPRGLLHEPSYDFSFSGLKTAVRYYLRDHADVVIPDVCASVQQAIVDVLVAKTIRAAVTLGTPAVVIAGGVSANRSLRSTMAAACERRGLRFVAPRPQFSVDNAAMIGFLAQQRIGEEGAVFDTFDFTVRPNAIRALRS